MQKQPPSSICAVAAIAAALALGSTTARAQDAGPAPDTPTIALPAPTVAAPAPAAAPAPTAQISTPVVQAVPAATTPEPAAAPRAALKPQPKPQPARAQPAAARNAATRAAPAARTPAATAPAATAVPAAVTPPPAVAPAPATPLNATPLDPVAGAETAPPPAALPAARAQSDSAGLTGAEAGLIALLAAGGLAGAGVMVARSRRKRDEDEDEFAEPVSAEPVFDRVEPDPAAPVPTPERVAARQPEPATEGFAVPAGQVPTGAEREELLRQMVAAPPDEANPFTSPRSRRKRARLILQHRAHLQETQGAEPFDWRTYRSTQSDPRIKEPPVPA